MMARRSQVADTTLRTMAEYTMHGASVTRIAEAAGISVSAIYRHFASSEEIYEAAMKLLSERATAWILSSSNPDALGRLRDLFGAPQDSSARSDRAQVIRLLQISDVARSEGATSRAQETQAFFLEHLIDTVESGKRAGRIRADVHPETVVRCLIGLSLAGSSVSQGRFEGFSAEGTADAILDSVLAAIEDPASRMGPSPDGPWACTRKEHAR